MVDVASAFEPGVSFGIGEAGQRWDIAFDETSGWLRFSIENLSMSDHAIGFAPGAVAEIKDQRLLAVWLRPIFR
jgi:hypothetical protein